ncbi:MAG: RtcB family protein [Chitinophagales bacterium]
MAKVVQNLLAQTEFNKTLELNEKRIGYNVYGSEGIEQGAINQMEVAMKLPVTKGGALMADAHHGYGLPIGGVLATDNAVIPYGVGVDIGCRMCLSVYDVSPTYLEKHTSNFKKLLIDNTMFGRATFKRPKDHAVLNRDEFKEIKMVKACE